MKRKKLLKAFSLALAASMVFTNYTFAAETASVSDDYIISETTETEPVDDQAAEDSLLYEAEKDIDTEYIQDITEEESEAYSGNEISVEDIDIFYEEEPIAGDVEFLNEETSEVLEEGENDPEPTENPEGTEEGEKDPEPSDNPEGTEEGENDPEPESETIGRVEFVVTAQNSIGINVSWAPVMDARGYQVYRKAEGESDYSLIITSLYANWNDTSVETNKAYRYKVRAYKLSAANSVITGAFSDSSQACVVPGVSSLAAEGISNGINISWSAAAGVRGYQIFRKAENEGEYTQVAATALTSWTDRSAVENICYSYIVRAYTKTEDGHVFYGKYSSAKWAGYLGQVKNLRSADTNGIKLVWDAVAGARGYQIYRKAEGESEYTLAATSAIANWTDRNAAANTEYMYKVRAYGKAANGTVYYGNFSASKRMCVIGQVTGITVEQSANGLYLSWNAVDGVRGYQIYRRADSESEYTLVRSTPYTNWNDTTVHHATVYSYMVRAYYKAASGAVYYGAYSPVKTNEFLAQVIEFDVSNSFSGPSLSWASVVGCRGYQIYRKGYYESSYTLVASSVWNTWIDTSADDGAYYTYIVRAYDKSNTGKVYYGAFSEDKSLMVDYTVGMTNWSYWGPTYGYRSFIGISIDYQHLWMFINGNQVLDTPVVTGLPTASRYTPTGFYSILNHATSIYLSGSMDGESWYSFVNFWMGVTYDGIGMHDAPWRGDSLGSYGSDIYTYNGSHGCINIPYWYAYYIYYNSWNGMPVIIF